MTQSASSLLSPHVSLVLGSSWFLSTILLYERMTVFHPPGEGCSECFYFRIRGFSLYSRPPFLWRKTFISFGYMHRSGIARSFSEQIFTYSRDCQVIVQIVSFYTPTSKIQEFRLLLSLPTLHIVRFSVFLNF